MSISVLFKIFQPPRQKNNQDFNIPSFLFFMLIFVFIIKIIFIALYPSSLAFHGDEAINSRNAQINFESGISFGHWNLLGSGQGTLNEMPALWYFLQGGIIHFLGPSLLSLKIFSLASDLFLCCFIFLIIKKIFNQSLAYLGTILYISFPISIHFSMTGYQNLQSTVMLYWSIYLLLLISKKDNYKNLIYHSLTAGILCGLSLYFYLSSIINPAICLLIIFFIVIFEFHSNFRSKLKYIFSSVGSFSLGTIVPAIPFLYYSFFKYKFATGRSSEFIFDQLMSKPFETLIFQTKNFINGFSSSGIFNGSGSHYIDVPLFPGFLLYIFFVVGLFISLLKPFKRKYFIPLIVFLITSISGGILTKEPPTSQRLIHIFPSIIIFVMFAVDIIKNKYIQKLLVVSLFVINIHFYITKNIQAYKQGVDRDVVEVSEIFKNNSQIIYFLAPIHKKDQIYFYSQGNIKLETIDEKKLNNINPGYYFLDNQNLDLLNSTNHSKYKIMRQWSNTYDHTTLLKFN